MALGACRSNNLRQELGLTQGQMGKLIRRSRPTIQAIELGDLRLTEDLAAKISEETGIGSLATGGEYGKTHGFRSPMGGTL
jgi:DNA-binding XRE family transcriptional regulator